MFTEVIDYYQLHHHLGNDAEYNLRHIADYYNEITADTKAVLTAIKEKYHFDKRAQFLENPTMDTRLEFFRDSNDYGAVLTLFNDTGNSAIDKEFGTLIAPYHYNNYKEIKDEKQAELYYDLYDGLFHAWLAYLWQSIKAHEFGMAASIVENNSVRTFFLSDFAWQELSVHDDFKDTPAFTERCLQRDLSFSEAYSRAAIVPRYMGDLPVQTRILHQQGDIQHITINKHTVSVEVLNKSNEVVDRQLFTDKAYDGSWRVFAEYWNRQLNAGWVDVTYSLGGK